MARQLISLSSEDVKNIQGKSLNIAEYVFHFCRERNIRVYIFAGSLLGAVRHKGFIPWDDDIDMTFPAPDWKKFVEAWEKEADKEHYSLCIQTKDYNDHTLSESVRDNMTTFITDSTVDSDVNQGLSIDMGPMHACPKSRIGQKYQLVLAAACSLFKAGRIPARQSQIVKTAAKILLGIFRSPKARYFVWHNLERMATKWDANFDEAEYVREFTMFPYITWLYPRAWFDKAEWVKFEDTEVPIPIGAKEYLKKRYGDYMQLPPEKDRHPEHRVLFMDLGTPYIEYKGKEYLVSSK